MHIALLGASGLSGRQVLEQAKQRGWHVTAVVRDPTCLDDIKHDKLQVGFFDFVVVVTALLKCKTKSSNIAVVTTYL